ncbi:class II glutamine amidotransferase [Shewanella rhizosphaerae]|uniref:class II glutamine amidotransferase n=1 Tax=Shewanella rhizosphaerae TaxID=2864207 RepID=UPI001C659AF6|nr:class II glutamine amidotransferase [Shewanella rhizosphaerae]QYK14619.1 class II glutamine amidotransferase [Shewanella rhizosphaerae]
MCRFLTYSGPKALMSPLIFKASNSLVMQSKYAQKRKVPTNADGFGLGWYPTQDDPIPATFVNVDPAWSNRNLKMIAEKVETQHYFAHVRDASKGMPVSQANCHPFSCMHYLWMHNGRLDQFDKFRRQLLNQLSDRAFALIKGNTDSEYAFALFMDKLEFAEQASLSQLENAMEATIACIMRLRKAAGADTNAFINFAVTDGKHTVVTRFATLEGVKPASLFFGRGKVNECLEGIEFIPHTEAVQDTEQASIIICSEPPTDQSEHWTKVERNHMVSAIGNERVSQRKLDLPFQSEL